MAFDLTEPVALVIAAVIGTPIWGLFNHRRRKADQTAMEKLVAKVTEEASEEYRATSARMEQQYKDEIRRLEKQYKESILWYQQQLRGRNDG